MHTVSYASSRGEIWYWYWRAWKRPAGLWRVHVLFGLMFAFVLTVLLEPGGFRLDRFLASAAIATLACVALLPLWPQIRFKSATRSLTINPQGITTSIRELTASRSWNDIRTIEEINDAIVITGSNKNAFIIPARAFLNDHQRKEFFAAACQWHAQAAA